MKRKSIVIISVIAVLLITGVLLWRFLPVKVLKGIDSETIVSIAVTDCRNGNQFEITDQDDISQFISNVHQITFQKKEIASVPGPWYHLNFINKNREVAASLEIQNYHSIRYKFMSNHALFLYSNEEMKEIGNYLQQTESVYFPDYNKDPDFS